MRRTAAGALALLVGLQPGLLLGLSACSSTATAPVDGGGADFALAPQVTHVGPSAPSCCMVAAGATRALYLANPSPPATDASGHDRPASGELHLVDASGADRALGSNVPAFGYAFSPDGRLALYLTPTGSGRFALELLPLDGATAPAVEAIADGLQNAPLLGQAYFTPSGRYLVAGVLPPDVATSPDLHVVDLGNAREMLVAGDGGGDYANAVTADDTLVRLGSTASTVPGVPSVEGLYLTRLAAATVAPTLVDTHVASFALCADGAALVYARIDGTLVRYGLADATAQPLADGVTSFAVGPTAAGPLVYSTADGALHAGPLARPATLTTAAGAVGPFSPFVFSADGAHLYWFAGVSAQNATGDAYHAALPSGAPTLVATNASTRDFHFVGGRLLYLAGIDATGTVGDVVTAALDGSALRVAARGAATGGLVVAGDVVAHLTNATFDPSLRTIDGSRAIVGTLAWAGAADLVAGGGEHALADGVPDGRFVVGDDGVILYVAGASFSRIADGNVGTLGLAATRADATAAPTPPPLTGVSEIGPLVGGSAWVDAPAANPPGLYWVHY